MRRHRLVFAAAILGLLVAACSAGAASPPTGAPTPTSTPAESPATPPSAPASPVTSPGGGEIGCDAGGHDAAYHIHSLVVVNQNGQVFAPPANIGIGETCMYWVHTHAADGIVHVEAPAAVHPTLGDFLAIWEATYPDDELLATARQAIAAGEVTVDDQPFDGNALELAFVDKMRIGLGS